MNFPVHAVFSKLGIPNPQRFIKSVTVILRQTHIAPASFENDKRFKNGGHMSQNLRTLFWYMCLVTLANKKPNLGTKCDGFWRCCAATPRHASSIWQASNIWAGAKTDNYIPLLFSHLPPPSLWARVGSHLSASINLQDQR